MKHSLLILTAIITLQLQGQVITDSGVLHMAVDQSGPCVSPQQRTQITQLVNEKTALFRQFNQGVEKSNPLFSWPVRKAAHSPYDDNWAISNYVDHNTAFPNQILDYQCGSRTYDTAAGYNHQGVDIFTWPFSWSQYYNNEAEVIAAAPGEIIYKNDGEFDQSCSFNSNLWNAIYLQHSDGSISMYGHMKANTLTSKGVGDMVTTGEYLGVIGSSGNSTGPHLHFEVFDNTAQLIDPYAGPCNGLNSSSWWSTQKDYNEAGINALLTHSALPDFNMCPQIETLYLKTAFDVADPMLLILYIRGQQTGETIDFSVYDDQGASFTFQRTLQGNDSYGAVWTQIDLDPPLFTEGSEWTVDATYKGITKSTTFSINEPLDVNKEVIQNITFYPNPVTELLTINASQEIETINVYDLTGKLLLTSLPYGAMQTAIDMSNLSSGIYMVSLELGSEKVIYKIIKD
ncbi:MAG: peptidoglycan DD-metalloendopeptidase family protein [Flavobacteriaceae bacterium]